MIKIILLVLSIIIIYLIIKDKKEINESYRNYGYADSNAPSNTYIPQRWGYQMPYTHWHNCERPENPWKACPETRTWKTCRMNFNNYNKEHIQNWLQWNNVMIQDNPGNKNKWGDAYISCKAMGYDAAGPDMDRKYRKIGWINNPFSCRPFRQTIAPEIDDDTQSIHGMVKRNGGTNNLYIFGNSGNSGNSSYIYYDNDNQNTC